LSASTIIGFWVDDVVEQGKIRAQRRRDLDHGRTTNNRTATDQAHSDLNGIIFDIAAHGWPARR